MFATFIDYIKPLMFILVFTFCLVLESTRAQFEHAYKKRFMLHFIFLFLGIMSVKVFIPKSLSNIFNSSLNIIPLGELNYFLALGLSIIILDFFIYWQHRLSHKLNFLWRFHIIHHSDNHMDLTSGFRFHPVEIYLSALFKLSLIYIFGIRLEHFIIYETVLFSMSIFNHSNIKINAKFEKFLRLFIVTPQMHYPHHHPSKKNTNSNYGNFLSLWDRLFKSYNKNYTTTFGVDTFIEAKETDLLYLLKRPFIFKNENKN